MAATLPNAPLLQPPNVPTYRPPQPFGYRPTAPGAFTGTPASVPSLGAMGGSAAGGGGASQAPFGAFSGGTPTAAFDPSSVQMDPGFGFRLSQGLKATERGAAARGTLLTGGAQKAIVDYGQNAASQEYGNAYQRALQTYDANRGTNQQNYGQALSAYGTNRDTVAQNFNQQQAGSATTRDAAAQVAAQEHQRFQDELAGYKANADTTLASNAQGLAAATASYDRNTAASDRAQDLEGADAERRMAASNANNAGAYQNQMLTYQTEQDRQRQDAQANLQRQEQERMDAAQRYQQQLQQEALQRAGSERQNAATRALKPPPGYLPSTYYPQVANRRA